MNGKMLILLLSLVGGGVACEGRMFLTCEDGTIDGANDAWFDVENCNEFGTTYGSEYGADPGYDECYVQSYDSIYVENIEEYCGEGFV